MWTALDSSVALPDAIESLRVTFDGKSVVVDTTSLSPRFIYLDE